MLAARPAPRYPARAMQLVGIAYSPWTEKARWSLEHHRLPYTYREYTPFLDETWLRLRARKPFGPISVPTLLTRHGAVVGSYRIGQFADHAGRADAPLAPPAHRAAIDAWEARSDVALDAARSLAVRAIRVAPADARLETLPRWMPGPARELMAPAANVALTLLALKYGFAGRDAARDETVVADALEALRIGLREAHGRYLVGGAFSWADIAMAAVVNGVHPAPGGYVPIGEATRRVWTHAAVADRFRDLIEWRDELYARHRPLSHG